MTGGTPWQLGSGSDLGNIAGNVGAAMQSQPPVTAALSQPAYLPEPSNAPVGVTPDHLMRAQQLVAEFSDIAPPSARCPDGLPPYRGVELEAMKQVPGCTPARNKLRRYTPAELEACREYITDLLQKGWISPAQTEFGSPVLFVEKPTGGLRVVIDGRARNKCTLPMDGVVPTVPELLDKLHGKTIFSTIDLLQGYNQIRLLPSDVPHTGMTTPLGTYVWNVLPMGARNASFVYQATLERILAPMIKAGKVHIYQDDAILCSSDPDEHLADLKELLSILRRHKLYINIKKLKLFQASVKWLGFVVSADGLRMDPDKVSTITNWPQPADANQLRSFLGFANYFRKFIQGMASIAAPLTDLMAKSVVSFKEAWTPAHTDAFQALKEALSSPPVLKLPDFGKPLTVILDASLLGTGAVLMQEGHPIAYTSKKFSPTERNYTTTEQELFGVVRALQEWRYACEGPQVTIQTDHNPLVYLPTQASISRRVARWMEFLARFNLIWQYKPGRLNIADPLSRNPALAMALIAAWACVSTRSASRAATERAPDPLPPTEPQAAPRLPPRKKRRTQEQPQRTEPAQHGPETDLVPLPPFVDRIRSGYAEDTWLCDPSVRSRCLADDTGLIQVEGKTYVPDVGTLRTDIIHDLHASPYAGHMGPSKTIDLVRRLYWWEGLRGDVLEYVKHCHSCQVNKPPTGAPPGLMQPVEIPSQPWECVSTDWITHLPKSKRGYTAILTFVCKLTSMVHFVPCTEHMTAADFAWAFLDNVVKLHGLPKKILSDRDPRFTGSFMRELCKLLQVHQALSTAFHPCTDGATERMHRTVQATLRHFVSPVQDDWDTWLPCAEFAINNSVQDSRQRTPFSCNYGFHPRTPLALELPSSDKNPAARVWLTDLKANLEHARKCLETAQQTMKARADKGRRESTFAVGDMVVLNTKHLKQAGSRKFAARWSGPFKITELVGASDRPAVAVRLDLPARWRIHPVFHVSLLKHYHSDGRSRPAPPPLFYDGDGVAVWEVSHLLDERTCSATGEQEFKVRWMGYGPEEDSWSRESDILDKALIADLRARRHYNVTGP